MAAHDKTGVNICKLNLLLHNRFSTCASISGLELSKQISQEITLSLNFTILRPTTNHKLRKGFRYFVLLWLYNSL